MAFYLELLRIPGVADTSVTFMCHSLGWGGGLASLMAVSFNSIDIQDLSQS